MLANILFIVLLLSLYHESRSYFVPKGASKVTITSSKTFNLKSNHYHSEPLIPPVGEKVYSHIRKETLKDKAKLFFQKYGSIFVVSYFSIYILTLSSLFLALEFDIFNTAAIGINPDEAVHHACEIFQKLTGNDWLTGYITDHPRGEFT